MGVGVWAEFTSDQQVRSSFQELAAADARLHLVLPARRLGDATFATLTRQAAASGVRVSAWLLLEKHDGYWIGESNAHKAADALQDLVRWCGAPSGPKLEAVSFDLEPDLEYAEALRRTPPLRFDRWVSLLSAHVDPGRFARARSTLARSVQTLHDHGLAAHAVTLPMVLDQEPGEVILEDALDIPVSGIDWDEVSVMVYQTAFAQLAGGWVGSELVRSYGETAIARYGDRAGVDLGVVGNAGVGLDPGDRYGSPEALQADIEVAASIGIPRARMRVYGLDGMLEEGGMARWLAHAAPAAPLPTDSSTVQGIRNAVRALASAVRLSAKHQG